MRTTASIILFYLLSLLSSSLSLAQYTDPTSGVEIRHIQQENIPRYLYRWMSPNALLRRALNTPENQLWGSFQKLTQLDQRVLQDFPEFANAPRGGVFTWSTVTAMMSVHGENYGEVLVRFEIDPSRVQAAHLIKGQSKISAEHFNEQLPLDKTELVLHEQKRFKEWILLNPDAIIGVTADPQDMKPEIEQALAKLKNDKYVFQPAEIHMTNFQYPFKENPNALYGPNDRNYAYYRLKRFLEAGRKIVPDRYLNRKHVRTTEMIKKEIRQFRTEDNIRFAQEYIAEIKENARHNGGARNATVVLTSVIAIRLTVDYFDADIDGKLIENAEEIQRILELYTEALEYSDFIDKNLAKEVLKRASDFNVNINHVVSEIRTAYSKEAEYQIFLERAPQRITPLLTPTKSNPAPPPNENPPPRSSGPGKATQCRQLFSL